LGLPDAVAPRPVSKTPFPTQQSEVPAIETRSHRLNEQIRLTPVRVISAEGEQLGIIPTEEALGIAREAGQDLVEVAPEARPPVCRIMDYGKFKYEQKKRSQKGHQHTTRTKEIRLRPKTGQHDIDFKVSHAREFLEHKNKVTISVVFRGREIVHAEEGRRVLDQMVEKLADVAKIELSPSQQGRRIVCTLAPK